MPAVDAIHEKNVSLFDFKKITDENGERLLAFGKYAGIAGVIDFVAGLV